MVTRSRRILRRREDVANLQHLNCFMYSEMRALKFASKHATKTLVLHGSWCVFDGIHSGSDLEGRLEPKVFQCKKQRVVWKPRAQIAWPPKGKPAWKGVCAWCSRLVEEGTPLLDYACMLFPYIVFSLYFFKYSIWCPFREAHVLGNCLNISYMKQPSNLIFCTIVICSLEWEKFGTCEKVWPHDCMHPINP